jgi:tight adherence protein C
MSSELVLLLGQIVFSLTVSLLVVILVKRYLSRSNGLQPDNAKQAVRYWPRELRSLERIWPLIGPVCERYVGPSPSIRHELRAIAADHRFDDQEFSRVRLTLMVLAAVAAAAVGALIALMTHEIAFMTLLSLIAVAALMGFYLPRVRLRDRYELTRRRVVRVFPSFLDVLALTLESGLNFQSALQLAAQRLPRSEAGAGLRAQLDEILRDIRSGEHRLTALQRFSDRLALPQVTQFVASVTAAERQGVSVSVLLRRQAEQLRTSRALSAERHAMKMPVKLLAPLAICIFPCTFAILAFPLSVRLMGSGLF